MIQYKIFVLLILSVLSVTKGYSRDLWKSAVISYPKTYSLGEVTKTETVYKNNGELEESSEYVAFVDNNGHTHVRSGILNGKVVESSDLKKIEEELNSDAEQDYFEFDPFNPSNQLYINYVLLGEVPDEFQTR